MRNAGLEEAQAGIKIAGRNINNLRYAGWMAWWAVVHGVTKSWTRLSNFTFTFHFHALEKEMATHSSVLAWRIPGRGSLVGCRLWGCTESDTTEAMQQQQQQLKIGI